jgi:hypothetical protein
MSTSGNLFSSAWQTVKDIVTLRYDPTHGIGSANGKPGLEGGVEYTDGRYEKFPTHPAVALATAPIGLVEVAVKTTAGVVAAGLEAAAGDGKAPEVPASYKDSVTPEEAKALEEKLKAGNPDKKAAQQMVSVAPEQSAAEKEKARKEAGATDYTVAV